MKNTNVSGALLRSEKAQGFQALGADGQPVYSAALPLREAVRLQLGADAANCLALVQPSENGESFDWYAPFPGDVVPWSSATDEERADALARLTALNGQLFSTAARMEADVGNREKQVFARLLRKAVHFPGSEYVYLVDGKPVVTFWGFAESGAENLDPLRFLRTPVAAPFIAPPAMAAAAAPVVAARSRWRWLWWLLFLLLLLLLTLFLLRACAPQTKLPLGLSDIDLPGLPAVDRELDGARIPYGRVGRVTGDGVRYGYGGDGVRVGDVGATDLDGGPLPGQAGVSSGQNVAVPGPGGAGTGPDLPPPPLPDAPAAQDPASPGPPLHIPPEALQDNSTDFLNGKWRADTGLRDTRNNQPLEVDYTFQNGKGEVHIRHRHDGVTCSGPASASLQGGKLGISPGKATCSDGSSYDLPQVQCQPGSGAANCQSIYQDRQFPMGIRRQP